MLTDEEAELIVRMMKAQTKLNADHSEILKTLTERLLALEAKVTILALRL